MTARPLSWDSGLAAVTGTPWPGVRYFSTCRIGGISLPPWDSLNLGLHVGDDPAHVIHNRASLLAVLPGQPVWLDQVHGTGVWDAAQGVLLNSQAAAVDVLPLALTGAPCADASITCLKAQPLAILTADCLPVVLSDQDGTVLGAAHAGWRGLAAGVLENTLAALRRQAPAAQGWRAWIGPAIGPEVFEVGDEVRQAFVGRQTNHAACFLPAGRRGHWLADLAGLARHRLQAAGVDHIELSRQCTYQQSDQYFSYRRQVPTGRQATVAWLV
ncbi:peptidoglycan editing factor PgeF [Castellaniella sp.]|uniref:peptidoglycan editing factor PgeF n=1 Tax=Castellaniella sp. TaxID=1955812 RepID=UPI002B002ED3|nr:peptidoglycan editing factor PgeF [Castellaniella sp.]